MTPPPAPLPMAMQPPLLKLPKPGLTPCYFPLSKHQIKNFFFVFLVSPHPHEKDPLKNPPKVFCPETFFGILSASNKRAQNNPGFPPCHQFWEQKNPSLFPPPKIPPVFKYGNSSPWPKKTKTIGLFFFFFFMPFAQFGKKKKPKQNSKQCPPPVFFVPSSPPRKFFFLAEKSLVSRKRRKLHLCVWCVVNRHRAKNSYWHPLVFPEKLAWLLPRSLAGPKLQKKAQQPRPEN